MKVSKVGNTKTAVGKDNQVTGGFLYTHPGKKEDLNCQLNILNKQAKVLYNLFVPIQEGQEPHMPKQEDFIDKEDIFQRRLEDYHVKKANYDRRVSFASFLNRNNRTITDVLFKRIPNEKQPKKSIRVLCSGDEVISKLQDAQKLNLSDDEIKELVVLALRKSVKETKIKDDKTFCATEAAQVFLKNFGNKNITEEDQPIIKEFVNAITQDYNKFDPQKKDSLGEKTVRSIKNQNMLFQPNKDTFVLSPINIDKKNTNHKYNEKQGYEVFLSLYADLEMENRKDLLCKLNRLLDLYFETPEEEGAKPSGEVIAEPYDAFDHHVEQKKEEGDFVKIPDVLTESEEQQKKLDSVVKKQVLEKLKANIRIRNIACYRYAKEHMEKDNQNVFFDDTNINMFWIHHIENAIERILKKVDETNLYKLNRGYLKNKIWKDMLNIISIKYVAAGKAVYHFAMNDLFDGNNQEIKLGIINESVNNTGINSFDYEMIKARETLQREIAVNVQSSANNLARATMDLSKVKNNSDFLLWNEEEIERYILTKQEDDSYRNIFQFFGGKSNWAKQVEAIRSAYNKKEGNMPSNVKFLNDLRKIIYALRNESFHFTTASVNQGDWDRDVIGDLFEAETKQSISLERDTFYSNNLPMFYSSEDLKKVLVFLYTGQVERQSQIPSYNTVVVRNAYPEVLESIIGKDKMPFGDSEEMKLNWENACYYLCKEIYYNAFLSDHDSKELFMKAAESLPKGECEDIERNSRKGKCENNMRKPSTGKYENAVNNFQRRIAELKELSLPEICQTIMTDYNMQNNGRKVRSSKDSLFDKEIYKHYKLLLHATLKIAFVNYIKKEDTFGFIKTPKKGQAVCIPAKDSFLPNWTSKKYDNLVEKVKKDAQLQKWYITGKFLSPRNLNLLLGSMRSYIQYVDDVRKRAEMTGNELHVNEDVNKVKIKEAIKVIEVCLKTAANISSEFTDYFESEESYALFLANYVDYGEKKVFEELKKFCNGLIKNQESQNALYTDAAKPKLNRNMVIAKLYGPTQILSKIVPKVGKEQIEDFYNSEKEIQNYKVNGKCRNKDEQEKLFNYQKLKNQVELRNVADYGELINELLGQLVNWSFIRERDLLYFQLGFHYYCLKNESEKPDEYKTIVSQDNKRIDGAILYQIAGMYINGIGVWNKADKENGIVEKAIYAGAGAKIKEFCSYSISLGKKYDELYNAGMEVFENIHEHESVVNIRNYIDHFHYYNDEVKGYSVLDLYSEVFDRFFTYDMKYQKNVTNMLENILAKHFYLIQPKFTSGEKKMGEGAIKSKGQIDIREIESEKFTYKLSDNTKAVEMSARTNKELENVLKILYYPKEVPKKISVKVPNIKEISIGTSEKVQNNGGGKSRNGNKKEPVDTSKYNTGKLSYSPFANIKL